MKVWLIGAGPGDPGLLTLKGRDALGLADAVIYDALANPQLLAFAKSEAELIYVGKVAGQHAMPQSEINALLAEKALQKGNVARLKGGDPYIFGRGGEEALYLAERGIPFEVIPGISSAIAAPAYAGIPLTHRDFVSSVMIITGHERPDKNASALDWQSFVASKATLVFLMGMKNLPEISANLIRAGMREDMPAAVVFRGATPMQKTVFAPLRELATKAQAAALSNPAVVVVGEVTTLAERLDWYGKRPLLGRNVVVTRAREQASELGGKLAELGANVLECPAIEIAPLSDYSACDMAIKRLHEYDWVIFTSVNGVKHFWERLAYSDRDSRSLSDCKVAAIGPATAHALQTLGIRPDLVPAEYVAESVAEALLDLVGEDLQGMRILLPRAAQARMALPDKLAEHGAIVDIVPMYETRPGAGEIGRAKELLMQGRLDCITFASSSTVDNFLKLLSAEELRKHAEVQLAAIGPITAKTLSGHGLTATVQPSNYTIDGLIEAIVGKMAIK